MTPTLKLLLVLHIIFGLAGVIAFYAVWMGLLKKELNGKFLKRSSFWGAVLIVLSWISGGYYYWDYYGTAVKTVIKAGPYPWAHAVFMEGKEHVFLFLPFLTVLAAVIIWHSTDELDRNPVLKKELAVLTGVITALGIIITLSGTIISGAVR